MKTVLKDKDSATHSILYMAMELSHSKSVAEASQDRPSRRDRATQVTDALYERRATGPSHQVKGDVNAYAI